jgi:hypothetical protein
MVGSSGADHAAGQQNQGELSVDLFDGQSSSQGGWMIPDVAGCAV